MKDTSILLLVNQAIYFCHIWCVFFSSVVFLGFFVCFYVCVLFRLLFLCWFCCGYFRPLYCFIALLFYVKEEFLTFRNAFCIKIFLIISRNILRSWNGETEWLSQLHRRPSIEWWARNIWNARECQHSFPGSQMILRLVFWRHFINRALFICIIMFCTCSALGLFK